MISTELLKTNIICDDPTCLFSKDSLIYVKGDVLFSGRSNSMRYITLTDFKLFKISTTNGYNIQMQIVDIDMLEELKIYSLIAYIIFDYPRARNRMSSPIIEIKTKI